MGQEHKHSGKQAAGDIKAKNQGGGRNQILFHQRIIGAVHRTSRCLHAGSAVLFRAQFQGAEASIGDGTSSRHANGCRGTTKLHGYDGRVLHAQRRAVEPRWNSHPLGKGHNGLPVLQILQRNDGRTVA